MPRRHPFLIGHEWFAASQIAKSGMRDNPLLP